MAATIEPEPSEDEREAILAALAGAVDEPRGEWAETGLLEGIESGQADP
ncbi:MAG TPA: hypothetical protein VM049_01490 [Gaiellaceae bacterium]|nr:hypothetical protein [Gaiellaceae bacterium]